MRFQGRRIQHLTLIIVFLILLATVALQQTRVHGRDRGGAVPPVGGSALADSLRAEGTLDPAARGTFDPQGMTLRTSANGAPVFQPATRAITGTWDSRFADALPSSGVIRTVFVAPNGDLYVGGQFSRIAGITATSIARWDGSSWSALGTDRSTAGSPTVHAITLDGDDVYVGGQFQSFGGVTAQNLARWDGQAWHAIGSGFEPSEPFASGVGSLAVFQGELLIAGSFTSFNGVPAHNLVRWDGTAATAIDTNGFEYFSMATTSHGVYMTAVHVGYAHDVLVWNGTTLAPLFATPTYADGIQAFDDDLYLLRRFSSQPGVLTIEKWDGAAWTTAASGLPEDTLSFAVGAQGIYVGTETTIQRWTGSAWQHYVDCYFCRTIAAAPDGLYMNTDSLVRYDGVQQSSIAVLMADPAVIAARAGIAYVGTASVVGTHGSNPNDHLFQWNDGTWTNIWPYLGDWFSFSYPTIAEDGTFYIESSSGGQSAQIRRYRDSTWQVLPDQPNVFKRSMVLSGTDLLMFDGSYYGPNDVYRWDGASWSSIPGPTQDGEHAHHMFVFRGQIYMTMIELRTGQPDRVFLRRWTGSQWINVGPEMSGRFNVIAVTDDAAYFGGTFQIGNDPVQNVLRWDGTTVHSMGATDGFISAIAASGTAVYLGGAFGQIDGCACTNLGRWNGSAWEPLGSGTNGTVRHIAVDGQLVYVQGEFSLAGDLPAMGMSLWHEQPSQDPPTPTPTATATVPTTQPTATATAPTPTATLGTPTVTPVSHPVYLPLIVR
jgi:hypothetical protein